MDGVYRVVTFHGPSEDEPTLPAVLQCTGNSVEVPQCTTAKGNQVMRRCKCKRLVFGVALTSKATAAATGEGTISALERGGITDVDAPQTCETHVSSGR